MDQVLLKRQFFLSVLTFLIGFVIIYFLNYQTPVLYKILKKYFKKIVVVVVVKDIKYI